MVARTKPYPETCRQRIRAGKVLGRLLKFFNGEIEMTAQQVRVGLALINKVVPDLKSVEYTADKAALKRAVISALPEMTVEEWQREFGSHGPRNPAPKPH